MGKIIASEMITLNGYFSGPNGETDWFMWDKDTDRKTFGMLTHTDCLLLGHETYKVLSGYWPTATEEDPEYIQRINGLKKLVVSTQSPALVWNAERVEASNDEELLNKISRLKSDKNLLIFGSGTLVTLFSGRGLIDEYRLFVNPIILGSGKLLFGNTASRSNLELTDTKVFGNGVVLLEYSKA